MIGWLFGSECLLAVGIVGWLSRPDAEPGGQRLVLLAGTIFLHLFAAISFRVYGVCQLRERRLEPLRALLVHLLPVLSLLPYLGALLVVLCEAAYRQTDRSSRTLAGTAYGSRHAVHRLPAWARLQESLHPGRGEVWWGSWWKPLGTGATEDGPIDAKRSSIHRLKLVLLPFDAAALTWLAASLSGSVAQAVSLPSAVLSAGWSVAGLGALLWIVGMILHMLRRGGGTPSPLLHESFGRYLMLGPALALFGNSAAVFLLRGEASSLGWLLVTLGVAGTAGLILSIFVLVLAIGPPSASQNVIVLYICVSLAVLMVGLFLVALPVEIESLFPAFGLGPAVGIYLGATRSAWLLWPWRGRQVFAREISLFRRGTLAFLAISLAMPLGGLTIPLWILLYPGLDPARRDGAGSSP